VNTWYSEEVRSSVGLSSVASTFPSFLLRFDVDFVGFFKPPPWLKMITDLGLLFSSRVSSCYNENFQFSTPTFFCILKEERRRNDNSQHILRIWSIFFQEGSEPVESAPLPLLEDTYRLDKLELCSCRNIPVIYNRKSKQSSQRLVFRAAMSLPSKNLSSYRLIPLVSLNS